MAKTKQPVILFIIFIGIFIFSKCANQMSPPGGDIDTTPPTIIETYPENYTVNFTEQEIEFTFSEYVNKRNISEAFFISPLIEGFPEFSWTNKTVYIEFPESLKSNTTYSVIIGTEITDYNNNNKMSEPFTLTFSTGSKIDSGKISGTVHASKAEGTLIFAYKDQTNWIDIYKVKPSYLSQINEKGYYELVGLGNGNYRIFAVKDEFKDFVYDVGSDLIGLPSQDVSITDSVNHISGINFRLMKEDTLSPNVQNVTMTDQNHLIVEFDEAIDSAKMSIDNFSINDSTINERYNLKYWLKTNSNKNEYILILTDSLNIENEVYLITENIKDRAGNISEYQSISFTPSDKPDTNAVTLTKISTEFEREKIDYLSPSFSLIFNDGFDFSYAAKAIKMIDPDSAVIPLEFNFVNHGEVGIKTRLDLKPKTKYTLLINFGNISDAAGNKIDTLVSRSITTIDDLYFSGALGEIKSNAEKVNVVLESLNRDNKTYQTETDAGGNFNFERIIPGEYFIWAYADTDSNNIYTFGSVKPFEYSEQFIYYSDTLNLRARWPVGDILIDFNK